MKTLTIAAAFTLLASAATADPIAGLWQTQPDDGHYAFVQIGACGNGFCGKIVKAFEGSTEIQTPNIGKDIVIGMAPQGNGQYRGKVWRPSNDKIYDGKAEVSGNSMKLSGCVAGGMLCKSQTWTKLR
ncbi:MAG: DUF2147 domain-containing protein [Paracoccus sp. (in: a-proteobacteria)]|uniref:DUF2147 domain-containing protein n=1 Tax=Paracoccus sp. TaxID=267 RepID=UPI0026E0EFA4|nr:DUF2147 domain-containing protein [Paracoccus sp. (in: a-proteobacteria)]MDO5620647.1 DUF2147 domain-containing protein [Paracoccus sp. (in: a-proteobacteria)]